MKYKVKVVDICPKSYLISESNNCFLGVSINNPLFLGENIELLLNWLSAHFYNTKILIGDHLHRINEYILNGRTGIDAIEEGRKRGLLIAEKINKLLINDFENKFQIDFWETHYKSNAREREFKKLSSLFETHILFRDAIKLTASDFIDRQLSRGCHIHVDRNIAINSSIEYLLEEMSVFSVLIEDGYKVQVYPGNQLKILKDFANGVFTDIKSNLSKGIYIDLTIKKV